MALRLLAAALLVALVTWEYAPALRGGFVYEDYTWTDGCAAVPGAPAIGFTLRKAAMRESWCAQAGQPATAFHFVSLGLHLIVVGLVGALVWMLTGHAWAAWLAAAFFGVNAVGVEAVAYLSSRGELIAAIGVLGACLAALHRSWLLVGLLIVLGLTGKETAIVAVMLVPLCLWYQRGRPWGLLAALAWAVLGVLILRETATWWPWWQARPALGSWALLQTTAIARVLVLSVLPFGQTVDYDYARVPMALEWFAASFLLAGMIWAVLQPSRLRLCGVAWIVCAVAPRLLVPTPASVFSEHQFYLPLVGVALVLASFFTQESHVSRSVLTHG